MTNIKLDMFVITKKKKIQSNWTTFFTRAEFDTHMKLFMLTNMINVTEFNHHNLTHKIVCQCGNILC